MKNFKYIIIFIYISGLLLPAMLPASEKQSFTLKEVQDYAVKNSFDTQNARLDVSIAKKKIWETTAMGLPQINGVVSYQDNTQIPVTLLPAQIFDPDAEEGEYIEMKFGTQHNAFLEITASQLVFQGSYIVALQAAKIFLKISHVRLAKTEIEVKEAVTKTFYLILLAEDDLETVTSNIENLQRIYYETKELGKAGFLEDTDVDQIQLNLTELVNAKRSLERQIRVTYRLLKFQMGLDLNKEIKLVENLERILSGINSAEILAEVDDFNIADHIDYKVISTQERSFSLLLKKEKSEFLPTVSAYISHRQSAMRDEFNFFRSNDDKWFPSTAIGLDIKIPIFSSGMKLARVAQAKMDLQKVRNKKTEVERGLKLNLQRARSDFSTALEKSNNTRANVKLARRIYEKTLAKYKQGLQTSLQLTQTHNQYLSALSNHSRAVVELLNAKTMLDKALNKL